MQATNSPVDAPAADTPWHALTPTQCLDRLDATADGLTRDEAAARLARMGPNRLPASRATPLPLRFLRQFQSPLLYLLLAAAAVSLAIGDRTDAGFILVVLLINAAIGTLHEQRAASSAEALRRLVHQVARVRRAGFVAEVDAEQLVPGDLVLLQSGTVAPADLRLLDTQALTADESLLTGEALPVVKDAAACCDARAAVADRPTMAHAGSTIVTGRATGLVVATGLHTQLGRIDASLRDRAPSPPPLMRYLTRLSRQIAAVVVALVAVLAAVLWGQGHSLEAVFVLSVAVAVSAVPEGLPIAVTVALAAATRRMAARNVIVRTLPAVEGLGACTVIATDKTGTLTLNRLSVEAVLLASGERLDRAEWLGHRRPLGALATAAATCNEALLQQDGQHSGDSVDVALLGFAAELGIGRAPPLALFPYEPIHRFSSAAVASDAGVTVYAKGALERVTEMCGTADPALVEAAEGLARQGYRVLALAEGSFPSLDVVELARPHGLRLIGCAALLDPLRPEAPAAVAACRAAGIDVRMITGDHPATALTIARQLGLAAQDAEVVTGAELAALAPLDFARRVASAKVFARIEPEQKLAIVEALRKAGHIVAVTGDGVNDAPALHAADIGVAMGVGGTDVARGAADLILADDNFASIVAGVEEGRIAFENLRKIAIFLLATGMAEIAIFLGAVLLGLPMPLTAVQILWLNLVTEGTQDKMLAFGRGEGDELARPPRPPRAMLIDGDALIRMTLPALAMAAATLWLLSWQLAAGAPLAEARNAVLLAVVLFQNAFVLSVREQRRSALRNLGANRWLLAGVAGALALQGLAMVLPPLQRVLGTSLPSTSVWLAAIGCAALTLLVSELVKRWRNRRL